MSARVRKWKRVWASFSGAVLLAAAESSAFGQYTVDPFAPPEHCAPPLLPSPYCPQAQPGQPQPQPSATTPGEQPSATPTPTPAETPAPANVDFDARAGAGLGESFALSAPNMIGNLLNASRSIRYSVTRVSGSAGFLGLGNTSISNAAVAENESPIPEDRVYFRYNYFNQAQSVTGASPLLVPTPGLPGALSELPQTRSYNDNLYTFGAEKTFFDGLMSVELRVPFQTTLAARNTFSFADVTGFTGKLDANNNNSPFFNTVSTPQNTLGHEDTEFGNLTLIFKSLFYQTCYFALSGGLSTTIPTGQNTDDRVLDVGGFANSNVASGQRMREFAISNDTWSVSPFLGFVATPTARWFTQGFLEFELPLNTSRITYSDGFVQGNFSGPAEIAPGALAQGNLVQPFVVNAHIREQILMHLDLGTGYWILRDPTAPWITGIAPTVEVHWTSTLDNAQVVNLPGGAAVTMLNPANPAGPQIPEKGPQIGSDRNRVDLVNLTLGTTFEIANRSTVATAVTIPLSSGDNKVFNWELQVQFNYFFGGPRNRRESPVAVPEL